MTGHKLFTPNTSLARLFPKFLQKSLEAFRRLSISCNLRCICLFKRWLSTDFSPSSWIFMKWYTRQVLVHWSCGASPLLVSLRWGKRIPTACFNESDDSYPSYTEVNQSRQSSKGRGPFTFEGRRWYPI